MNNRVARNPELEAMRETAMEEATEELNSLDERIADLLPKLSRIHAAFLFDSLGSQTLQVLCRWLISTKNAYNFAGWEEFGIHLGLTPLLIKCIACNNFNSEDPAYNTLLAFVQHEDAALSKIVNALRRMGRLDVINMTADLMSGLADNVLGSQMNNEESGYFSVSSGYSDSLSETEVFNRSSIIRPLNIPRAPFVLQEVISQQLTAHPYSRIQGGSLEEEHYQTAVPVRSRPVIHYMRKVMLTFASDGLHTAQRVATEFRKKRENQQRIGVVILYEHSELVNKNPEQFISACFDQVDYVVPVITEKYLNAICGRGNVSESSMLCTDTQYQYIKYIYNLMATHYVRNGCINDKIRCVIPDDLVHLTRRQIMARPLFQVWVRASEVEQLSQRMLGSRF